MVKLKSPHRKFYGSHHDILLPVISVPFVVVSISSFFSRSLIVTKYDLTLDLQHDNTTSETGTVCPSGAAEFTSGF